MPPPGPLPTEPELLEALHLLDRAPSLGLTTKAYYLQRAALLEALGDTDRARQAQKREETLKPAGALDHFLVGLDLAQQGKHEQSLAQLKRALDLQPDHFWANYYVASGYLKAQRPDAAVASLTACIQMRPDFLWAYQLRGFAHGQLDEFDAAFADFSRAEKLKPDQLARYGIQVNRGVVHYRQGQMHKSRNEDRLSQDSFEKAISELRQAIALRPRHFHAYANLAEVYLRCGKLDDAKNQLDQALALRPSAALYRSRAHLHLQRKDFDAALSDLEQAIARTPSGRRSRNLAEDQAHRGRILYQQQQYAEAVEAFDAAIDAYPSFALAYRLRGETLLKLNRAADAIAALDRYVAQVPPQAAVHRTRALAHVKVGNYTAAIADYTRSLEIDRENGRSPDAKTLAHRGWAYLVSDVLKLALEDFEAALRLPGEHHADCHNGRGYARVKLGQWRPALDDAEAALKLGPPQPRNLYNTARIYAQAADQQLHHPRIDQRWAKELAGKYEEKAITLLHRAIEATPPEQRKTFWNDYVKNDPALQRLRRQARILQLAQEFNAAPKEPRP